MLTHDKGAAIVFIEQFNSMSIQSLDNDYRVENKGCGVWNIIDSIYYGWLIGQKNSDLWN